MPICPALGLAAGAPCEDLAELVVMIALANRASMWVTNGRAPVSP
jgi:hypothetical protein